jgi:hypothetical protein
LQDSSFAKVLVSRNGNSSIVAEISTQQKHFTLLS